MSNSLGHPGSGHLYTFFGAPVAALAVSLLSPGWGDGDGVQECSPDSGVVYGTWRILSALEADVCDSGDDWKVEASE